LGTPILQSLINNPSENKDADFKKYIACVQSERSEQRLAGLFTQHLESGKLIISRRNNPDAVTSSDIVLLGVDPADVEETLKQEGLAQALKSKLLISLAAGWTRDSLENILLSVGASSDQKEKTWVIRTLPNIAAQVSESLTAIEDPDKNIPDHYLKTTEAIFNQVGETVRIAPRLMNAATAVGGSTPAFFSVICDALIDASVAVGVPRASAQAMIYQSMKGTAVMLQSGVHPGVLKDQGTSPEGCTIGGLMVLEEAGVRGHLGKALREAVTIARLMGSGKENQHVNDTRQGQ
jgi:pyrroline-5-carboxylate reductase